MVNAREEIGMKISAQNITVGTHFTHTAFGRSRVIKNEDIHAKGKLSVHLRIVACNGKEFSMYCEPNRMIEVVE